jgi:hypothetical protein
MRRRCFDAKSLRGTLEADVRHWVLALASGLMMSVVVGASEVPDRDVVRIESVTPHEAVKAGVETEFTIDVDVNLESADQGTVMIGFNTRSSGMFTMLTNRAVERGETRFAVVLRVTPVYWGESAPFAVNVNLGPKPEEIHWKPTALAKKEIEVIP